MKKAFTLVELLAVIVVMSVILAVILPNMIGISDKQKQNEYDNLLNKIYLSAETYLTTELDNEEYPIKIKLQDIIDEGYLSSKLINPLTEEELDYEGYILVTKNEDNILVFNYPDTTDIDDPIIIFEPNGSLKYQSSSLVKVTISDDVGFNPSSLKYLWNNSIEELEESDFSTANSFISGNNIPTPFVNGTYYLWILVKDLEGNNIIEHSNPFRFDQEPPAIVFGTNGDPSYTQIGSSVVTVNDNLKVNENSLKYIWNTSTTKPYVQEFEASGTAFTNGSTVSSPSELNGIYYLWVYGEDETGNGTTEGSNAFHLDNLAPVITISGDETVTIKVGDTYNDAGATALDNIDGSLSVTTTSTVNVNATGTYTVTYNAEDGAGNEATPVVRTVVVEEVGLYVIGNYGNATYGYLYKYIYNGSTWTSSQPAGTAYLWLDVSAY